MQSILLGIDFQDYINSTLQDCQVMVAVVGSQWLTAVDADGDRRLDRPDAWVRLEIATALNRDIPVIPLLVGNAWLPKAEDPPDGAKHRCRDRHLRPHLPEPDPTR